MDLLVLRERLHKYIDQADEQHLSAIYTLVENDLPVSDDVIIDESTMNILYERMENYEKGGSKTYTPEESFDLIKQHKKKHGL